MAGRFSISETATLKAIEAVRKSGLPIAAVEFPRGSDVAIRIVTLDSPPEPDQDARKPEPWT